jgi:hypothetical protein
VLFRGGRREAAGPEFGGDGEGVMEDILSAISEGNDVAAVDRLINSLFRSEIGGFTSTFVVLRCLK